MSDPEHLSILKRGVDAWNDWRLGHWNELTGDWDVVPDLSGADLGGADLLEANLAGANLGGAHLKEADLRDADLRRARLLRANLRQARLHEAKLHEAYLYQADLSGADLNAVDLSGAYLAEADLSGADLTRAMMVETVLYRANLQRATLRSACLHRAIMVGTDLTEATLTGARIHGISVWDAQTEGLTQRDLTVTPLGVAAVTVDDFEVAQFVYLLLYNPKIRNMIDTVGRKAVLILGRFGERKEILDMIREELRKGGFLPMLFDFPPAVSQTTMRTVSTLAHMARFVIVDLTDAKSVLGEIERISPSLPEVPIQMILDAADEVPPMADGFLIRENVLPPYRYRSKEELLESLQTEVIEPADGKAEEFKIKLAQIRKKHLPWQQGAE